MEELNSKKEIRNELVTPIGKIEVSIDGICIDYTFNDIPADNTCPDLEGRYTIRIKFIPDGKKHTIFCKIKGIPKAAKAYPESGERLECISFYYKTCKMSIGMEGDTEYYDDGTRANDDYDYDNEYHSDGVSYVVLPETKTDVYIFGIAWLNNYNDDNEVQTWFGADPGIIELKHNERSIV